MANTTSGRVIRAVCNRLRNSDLRADSPAIGMALDAEFDRLNAEIERLQADAAKQREIEESLHGRIETLESTIGTFMRLGAVRVREEDL